MSSAFHWAGKPSIFSSDTRFVPSAQGRSTTPPKSHPLRNAEAQKVGSASRAPTANVNTERVRIVRAKGAAI